MVKITNFIPFLFGLFLIYDAGGWPMFFGVLIVLASISSLICTEISLKIKNAQKQTEDTEND